MKTLLMFFASLLLTGSLAAQSVCRQAPGVVAERHDTFTVFSISLPAKSGHVKAQALVPNYQKKPTDGTYS
jgi:hypothetical protein